MGSKSRIGGIFWRAISKFTASSDGMSLSQTQVSHGLPDCAIPAYKPAAGTSCTQQT